MASSLTVCGGLRVVHVSARYPPALGGAEQVVESLARIRDARGFEVEVLTSLDGLPRTAQCETPEWVSRLPSWEIVNTPIIPKLLGRLLQLPRTSLIHLHVAQAFVPEMVFLAHLLRRIPYIAHVHLEVGPSGWAGVLLLPVWRRFVFGPVLRHAAAVVVLTNEQRSIISAKYRILDSRVVVIPNGVDMARFRGSERRLHARPRLLFVGRLARQKNLALLLEALVGVSERFDTLLVGDGPLENELKGAVAKMGLMNVRFWGRADGQEVVETYRDADVLVLPSEREGMPLVLLEALAMGLPIVATDVPGSRDVVVHGENGLLVPPGDPDALREALLTVTGDPDLYRRMSASSLRLAEKYSWEAIGTELERVYSRTNAARRA